MAPRRLLTFVIGTSLAVAIAGAAAAQEDRAFYQKREATASKSVKAQLESMRQQISARHLSFEVAYTTAMQYKLQQITGLVVPANLRERIRAVNEAAAKATGTIPPSPVAGACSDTATSFDWRKNGGATGVRDQEDCGSCWDFATLGAFEGNYRLRNNLVIDASEQDLLDCNSQGHSCKGGDFVYRDLIDRGVAKDADYPYTAEKHKCKQVARPYRAAAWGYVGNTETPSVGEIKKALCQHGPLGVAVRATQYFQAYAGGVFDDCSPGPAEVNHAITLIGWDDSKKAWLIKNSWGTGWGEAAGSGTERGYMWIQYGCDQVGYAASWVEASPCTGASCK